MRTSGHRLHVQRYFGNHRPPDFVILARLTHATFDDAAYVLFTTYCLNP